MKKKTPINIESDAVHTLHPYPCKFPGTTAREIIREFGNKGDVVFDPFVGSGTTLVEATINGLSSIGVDINPIACLISKVKATPLNKTEINIIYTKYICELDELFDKETKLKFKDVQIFNYPSIKHWFQNNVINELSVIKTFIDKIEEENIRDIFNATLSSIIVRVSNQESDTRYAAINKNIKDGFTFKVFKEKLNQFLQSLENFYRSVPNKSVNVSVFLDDTRILSSIKDLSVDLTITSPPYANTYDYYLYHKHRKYWLGMDVKTVMDNEIGSRREFSSLKKNPNKWTEDAKKSMAQLFRVTKKGGKVFLIIGDSVINKKLINNGELFTELGISSGFRHVATKSTPLNLHSSAFNPSFQAKKKNEHLIYFEKD